MGGYGAARIGMKHPEVFGALYMMSPGSSSARPRPLTPKAQAMLDAVTPALRRRRPAVSLNAQLAVAAAWSPNPSNPPLYLDLPSKDGALSRTSSRSGTPTRRSRSSTSMSAT